MMFKQSRIGAAFAAGCVLLVAGAAIAAPTPVNNLILTHTGEFTELSIPVASHHLCKHFSLPAAGNKPFRVVLDFCDTRHALAEQWFASLPASVISRIRTSQFAEGANPTVRVVLDLKESATYTVRPTSANVVIAIADPNCAPFAAWEAGSPRAEPPQLAVPTPMKDAPQPQMAMETVQRQAKVAQAPQTQPARKTVSTSPAKTSEPVSEPTVAMKKSPATETSAKSKAGKTPEPVKEPMTAAAPVQSHGEESPLTAVTSDVLKNQTQATDISERGATSGMAPGQPQAQARPFVLPDRPLVLSPEQLALGEQAAQAMNKPARLADKLPSADVDEPQVATAETPQPKDDPSLWASVNDPAQTASPKQPVAQEVLEEKSLIERLKTKFFGNQPAPRPYSTTSIDAAEQIRQLEGQRVDGDGSAYGPPTPSGSSLDREALLERIRQAEEEAKAQGSKGIYSRQGPPREELFYNDMGRRDPFEPLLGGLRSGFVTDDLPNVENLRMVGGLRDDYEALALLEDMEGHSYILRAGDAVEKGHVVSVREDNIVFQVDDYGWLRTVVLRLTPRGTDPSKALGYKSANNNQESVFEETEDE